MALSVYFSRCIYSLDWTAGLEYWTELFSFLDKCLCLFMEESLATPFYNQQVATVYDKTFEWENFYSFHKFHVIRKYFPCLKSPLDKVQTAIQVVLKIIYCYNTGMRYISDVPLKEMYICVFGPIL